jgi:HAD superfamily phosphatase
MGEVPDKPDPTGLIRLARQLAGEPLGPEAPPVAYLGDTVADVLTVQRARQQLPEQRFLSLAVAPPHLHSPGQEPIRRSYEQKLRQAGADGVIEHTRQVLEALRLNVPSPPAPSEPPP